MRELHQGPNTMQIPASRPSAAATQTWLEAAGEGKLTRAGRSGVDIDGSCYGAKHEPGSGCLEEV